MFLIISAFIELIFYILIIYCIPKKNNYEYEYMSQQYKEDYYNLKFYSFDSLCFYLVQNLDSSKKSNQAIIGMSIILFCLVFFKIILSICNKCIYKDENTMKKAISAIIIISFLLIIISWILSLAIVAKVNKLRKDDDNSGITNAIKNGIVKVIIILTADLIIGFIQTFISISKHCEKTYTNNSSSYTPTARVIYTNTNTNNYQTNTVSTTRTNVIMVKKEKKYIISLQRVLSNEVYSNLKANIEKGQIILLALIKYFEDMKFEGLTDEESIMEEIARIVNLLSILLHAAGDEVTKICIAYIHDDDALALLIQYLFPLILRVIKLKIEKGVYRRSIRTTSEQIIFLTRIEQTIERDENGNIRQTLRFRQQVSNASLINLLK